LNVLKDGGEDLDQGGEKGLTGNVKVVLTVGAIAVLMLQLRCARRRHLGALHANAKPNVPGNLFKKITNRQKNVN